MKIRRIRIWRTSGGSERRKEYRDTIIRGIGSGTIGGVLITIFVYRIQGEVPWASLILYPIFFAFAHLIRANLRMRREAKKEKEELSVREGVS